MKKEIKLQENMLPTVFEEKEVRRVWKDEQWHFVIEDVVLILTESKNVKAYINKMRKRDEALNEGYGQIVYTLDVMTKGGKQKMNCANMQGIFRIIQSISSPKAEPFKLWLAKVGQERIEEMVDPERALNRSREYWQKHGRSEKWIQQRMMGQETKNKLTDYWKSSGIKNKTENNGGLDEFAVLTNIIHSEWSELSIQKHKDFKSLKKHHNIRDHMSEAELIFTALAELSTRQIAESIEAKGLKENILPAKRGGKIAKDAKLALEEKTGKKVVNAENYLPIKKDKNKLN